MAASGEYGKLLDESEKPALSAGGKEEVAFLRSELGGRKIVLDLGCGPGFPLVFIADCVTEIYGMDASPAMLALAEQNIDTLGIQNTALVRGLAEALPFSDCTFDGIAICGALGSVPEPDAVLSEVNRVSQIGAVVASLEQDFRARLESEALSQFHWLRRETEGLMLQVVTHRTEPYLIRYESYILDPESDFCQSFPTDPEMDLKERIVTELSPEDIPSEVILNSFYEEEAQFDPETLRGVFQRTGFDMVEQHIAVSYERPHIFSLFRKC
jgi:ubiquinone/menaquinone biosynthesis C-methylase UbiE